MIPRVVLCEEHPRALVRINTCKTIKLAVSRDLLHLDIEPIDKCIEESDCLLYVPYRGMYHMNDLVEPLKSGDISYLTVVLDTRRTLKMYEMQITRENIQMITHALDDTFFRGYVISEDDKVGKRIIKKLVKQYQSLTIPIYCCLIKTLTSTSPLDTDSIKDMNVKKFRNCELYYSYGKCIYVKKIGVSRFNISLIYSISYSEEFLNTILNIFNRSKMILDLRLGRVDKFDEGVRTVLDVFAKAEREITRLSN
ncbi:MAG: hypothetical protein GXO23_06140 [Crenarchaeota archaeon]|nr:hypothetical protein [Thermoproteota archaeon]